MRLLETAARGLSLKHTSSARLWLAALEALVLGREDVGPSGGAHPVSRPGGRPRGVRHRRLGDAA
eukprot:10608515-Heterocapsa_arctica.AAC.1